jgi:hypothetical protein
MESAGPQPFQLFLRPGDHRIAAIHRWPLAPVDVQRQKPGHLRGADLQIAGAGQGLSFRAGLGLVRNLSPQGQAGRVASTFFVVLYIAISAAVIAIGLAAQPFGLRATGIVTAITVAALAATCAASLAALRQK